MNIKEYFRDIEVNWKTIIIVASIVVIATVLTRLVRWLINKSVKKASVTLRVDVTKYKFLKNAVSLIIWVGALATIVSFIPQLKALAITLFAGAGIFMAILGFAAQQAFSNIISGIFIVISKPFRVGDLIKVGTLDYGIVEDITLRHTVINNFENKRIIVPNSIIGSETIVNDSINDEKVCRFIEFGISYDSDVDLAIKIIQEEAMKHKLCIDTRTKKDKFEGIPQIIVRVTSFGDSSVNLRAYVWASDPIHVFQMHYEINKAVKKRFDAEGIEIPFPYRTIVYKNDLKSNAKK